MKKRVFSQKALPASFLLLSLNRFSILSVPLVKHVFTYGNDPNLFKVESEEKFNGLI